MALELLPATDAARKERKKKKKNAKNTKGRVYAPTSSHISLSPERWLLLSSLPSRVRIRGHDRLGRRKES